MTDLKVLRVAVASVTAPMLLLQGILPPES